MVAATSYSSTGLPRALVQDGGAAVETLSIVLAVIFTVLICLIEIPTRAKTSLRSVIGWPLLFYIMIYVVGNVFATVLAAGSLPAQVPKPVQNWLPFLEAFAGVFAFQGVIGNTNVTLFGRGVLTIEEWIAKARDHAVSLAIEKQVELDNANSLRLAKVLGALPDNILNTYLIQFVNDVDVAGLEKKAKQSNADASLYKAFTLVQENPSNAKALVKKHRKP